MLECLFFFGAFFKIAKEFGSFYLLSIRLGTYFFTLKVTASTGRTVLLHSSCFAPPAH